LSALFNLTQENAIIEVGCWIVTYMHITDLKRRYIRKLIKTFGTQTAAKII